MPRVKLPPKTWEVGCRCYEGNHGQTVICDNCFIQAHEVPVIQSELEMKVNWLIKAVERIQAHLNRNNIYDQYMEQAKIVEQGAWE